MVFSAKGFSFLTPVPSPGATGQAGLTGFSGFLCCFFSFPDEREKDNPPSAEGMRAAEGIGLGAERLFGGSGSRGFLRRPNMALWPARNASQREAGGPVQGYLSSSLRS